MVGFFLRGPSFHFYSRDSESAILVISGDVVGAITLLALLYLTDVDIFPLCKSVQFYWLESYFISRDTMINWLPHKISLH